MSLCILEHGPDAVDVLHVRVWHMRVGAREVVPVSHVRSHLQACPLCNGLVVAPSGPWQQHFLGTWVMLR